MRSIYDRLGCSNGVKFCNLSLDEVDVYVKDNNIDHKKEVRRILNQVLSQDGGNQQLKTLSEIITQIEVT